jgi:Concanavalin A-like lectin/glucanases superfamily
MRTCYIDRARAILTATLILFLACLSGCGGMISALSNSSSTSATLSSSSLVFGPGASSSPGSAQSVTLSNTGNAALNISTITLSGIDATSFSESTSCLTSLAAGSSCTITAGFAPVMAGSFTAAITITTTAFPSAQTILLSGTAPPVEVSVSPVTMTLNSGQAAQLTATVTNASNKALTWSISPVGVGSISTSGLYTAPAIIATAQTVTVTATSVADTKASSSSTMTLAPSVAVSVSPATMALNSGQDGQLTATVTNASNKAVTWSISPVGVGSISTSGLYTAPAIITTAQTVTVTATSVADTKASSSATMTLEPSVAVSVSPATMALNSGQAAQLTATVTNASNKGVTWSISPVGVGSISTSGLYTAPATVTAAQTVTVTATSQADTTASSSATIMLERTVAVSVSPAATTIYANETNLFSATMTNASTSSFAWSALLGTITSEGVYTAPSNTGNSALTDTITATSIEYPTKSATATVTVLSGLVGWWPLDEGTGLVAYDISGQGNNGTWIGPPSPPKWTYYAAGAINSAAGYFNSGNSVTIGTQPVYQFKGPFSVSAWVNTASNGMILTMQNGEINGYNLGIYSGAIRFCVFAGSTENCASGGSSPTWTYFTGVFDGSNISVYANGSLLLSRNAVVPTASTGPLVFGITQRGGYSNLTGSLSDVRLYNRALAASEISSLYNADAGTPNAPTNLQIFPGNGQVGLSWLAPTSGLVLTDYVVNYRQTGTSVWTALLSPCLDGYVHHCRGPHKWN